MADSQQGHRLGLDPGSHRLHTPDVRDISISGANTGSVSGHCRRNVYPANCDADGSTCYMHNPPNTDYQPG